MCARYVVRCVWGLRGAPEQAALRLWYVHSTQEAGTRSARTYSTEAPGRACQQSGVQICVSESSKLTDLPVAKLPTCSLVCRVYW